MIHRRPLGCLEPEIKSELEKPNLHLRRPALGPITIHHRYESTTPAHITDHCFNLSIEDSDSDRGAEAMCNCSTRSQ